MHQALHGAHHLNLKNRVSHTRTELPHILPDMPAHLVVRDSQSTFSELVLEFLDAYLELAQPMVAHHNISFSLLLPMHLAKAQRPN